MQMEKNEDGGSKESTRMTRRQGAEGHSARTFWFFSSQIENYSTTDMAGPNDGDIQRIPRLVTHRQAHYERWDVRRDVCARLQFLLLLAFHQLGWSADNGGWRPRPYLLRHSVRNIWSE